MLLVQGPSFENRCDSEKNPSPGELRELNLAWSSQENDSCRRCLDLRLQELRGCTELPE